MRVIAHDEDDAHLAHLADDPELAALGEQLTADAQRLASLYPPGDARRPRGKPVARSRRQMGGGSWAAAAAVLIAASVVCFGYLTAPRSEPAERNLVRGGDGAGELATLSTDASNQPPSVTSVAAERAEETSAMGSASPAIITLPFESLTGAEQEAVLDLLESEGLALSGLSI